MSPKNIAIAIVIIAVIVIAGLAFNKYTTQEITDPKQTRLQKVKIGYNLIFNSSFVKIGQEKGFFKDIGIEIEPIEYQNGNQLAEALVRGEVDVVCCSGVVAGLDTEIVSPGKIKLFTTLDDSDNFPWNRVLVKNESPIKSIKDLSGKKVAVFPGSIAAPTFKKYLEKNSVDISKLETVPTPAPNQIPGLESGSVDALWAYDPTGIIALNSGKYREIDNALYSKLNSKSASGAGFISTKFVKEKPILAKNIVKAIDRSHKYVRENQNEARALSGQWLKFDTNVLNKLKILNHFENSKIDINRTQEYVDFLYEIGIIKQKVNVSEMFYRAE
jgi:NitT/TauT family transport system substrate-binding protein